MNSIFVYKLWNGFTVEDMIVAAAEVRSVFNFSDRSSDSDDGGSVEYE